MTQQPNRGEIVIYRAPDGALVLPVKIERESVWLTQNQIAELFGVKKAAISKHISNKQHLCNSIPPMGKQGSKGIYHKRLCRQ